MGRKKKTDAKNTIVAVRFTESEFSQIKNISKNRQISQVLRNLIFEALNNIKNEEKYILSFSEKIDLTIELLKSYNLNNSKMLEEILSTQKNLFNECKRLGILIEEFARKQFLRSDIFNNFIESVEKRLLQ